jgi:hypothetical protein
MVGRGGGDRTERPKISQSLRSDQKETLAFIMDVLPLRNSYCPRFCPRILRSPYAAVHCGSGSWVPHPRHICQGQTNLAITSTEGAFFVQVAENEIPLTLQRFSKLKSLRPCSLDSITHRGQYADLRARMPSFGDNCSPNCSPPSIVKINNCGGLLIHSDPFAPIDSHLSC